MGSIFLLIFFMIHMLLWDLSLRGYHLLFPHKSTQYFNHFFKLMTFNTFKIARVYTGFLFRIGTDLDLKLPPSFLIISNHQSLIDIPAIIYALPEHNLRFVAKNSLSRYIPLISISLRIGKQVTIARQGRLGQTKQELDKMLTWSKEYSFCPLVFPEGTRSKTGKLKKFHKGAVRHMIKFSGLPILSVAVDGGYKLATIKDLFKISSKTIYRIKAMSLYEPPRSKQEIDRLAASIHTEIEHQLVEWRKQA